MICTDKVSISSIGKLLDHIQLQIYHFLLITTRNHSVFLHFYKSRCLMMVFLLYAQIWVTTPFPTAIPATMPCQNPLLSLQYN